jgi:hypothetical protein
MQVQVIEASLRKINSKAGRSGSIENFVEKEWSKPETENLSSESFEEEEDLAAKDVIETNKSLKSIKIPSEIKQKPPLINKGEGSNREIKAQKSSRKAECENNIVLEARTSLPKSKVLSKSTNAVEKSSALSAAKDAYETQSVSVDRSNMVQYEDLREKSRVGSLSSKKRKFQFADNMDDDPNWFVEMPQREGGLFVRISLDPDASFSDFKIETSEINRIFSKKPSLSSATKSNRQENA